MYVRLRESSVVFDTVSVFDFVFVTVFVIFVCIILTSTTLLCRTPKMQCFSPKRSRPHPPELNLMSSAFWLHSVFQDLRFKSKCTFIPFCKLEIPGTGGLLLLVINAFRHLIDALIKAVSLSLKQQVCGIGQFSFYNTMLK